MTPQQVFARIAECAAAVGWQAGIGACEVAGHIVSYLAAHPDKIETFLTEGYGAVFIDAGDKPVNPWREGCLTWLGMDGQIHSPSETQVQQ